MTSILFGIIEIIWKSDKNIFTNEEPYTIDTEKGLSRIPSSKAIGIDKVPGEWIKIRNNQAELKINELKIHKWDKIFRNWIEKGTIPDFWMNWRLILLSKEKNKVPKIENT